MTWKANLERGVREYLMQAMGDVIIPSSDIRETPMRVVRAFEEHVKGCTEDPRVYLDRQFQNISYSGMLQIRDKPFISRCRHHLEPIVGKLQFAYIPDQHVVGLSKIPRFINALSRRLSLQEELSETIIDTFFAYVRPLGCGIYMKAYHFCMVTRGVEECATTETTSLRGCFMTNEATRLEFINSIDRSMITFP